MNKKLANKSPHANRKVYGEYLSERIYGSITLVGINLGLLLNVDHIDVRHALNTVITTALGLWAASLFAEYMSYRVMNNSAMPKKELLHHIIVHRGILVAAIPTLILLGLASIDAIGLRAALLTDIILALIGLAVLVVRAAVTATSNVQTTVITIAFQTVAAVAIISLKIFSH